VPGARQIELAGAQTFGTAPQRATSAAAPSAAAGTASTAATPQTAYRTFNIVSPGQQETLWNTGSSVSVQLEVQPALQPSHRIDVYLDGERKNLDATSTQLTIPDVFRGVHTMQAVIVDQRGGEVLRSLATTFMVQQTSIQNQTQGGQSPARPPQPQPRRPGN